MAHPSTPTLTLPQDPSSLGRRSLPSDPIQNPPSGGAHRHGMGFNHEGDEAKAGRLAPGRGLLICPLELLVPLKNGRGGIRWQCGSSRPAEPS